MGLGVKGTFEDPRERSTKKIISVEMGRGECPLNCENCLTGPRRNYDNSDLLKDYSLDTLVKNFPKEYIPIIIGLGETTVPSVQRDIERFLNDGKIGKAHIQTNGGYALNKGLLDLVEQGKLTIGLSYDLMHQRGGQKNYRDLGIQSSAVSGISVAIESDETPIKGLDSYFTNLNRLLIHPYVRPDNKFKPTWEQLKKAIKAYSKEYPDQAVYTELSEFFKFSNKEFYEKASTELKTTEEEWKVHDGEHFFVHMPNLDKPSIRFLANGKFTLRGEESVNSKWEYLRGISKPIEEFQLLF